jgi:hypothetical protein
MADIAEVGAQIEQALSPDRLANIGRALAYISAELAHAGEQLAAALEGTDNKHGHKAQNMLSALAADIEKIDTTLPQITEQKNALLADWCTGSAASATSEVTRLSIVIPERPERHVDVGPMFDTTRNYFDFTTQQRLDVRLDRIITPDAVGADAARNILQELTQHGQVTIRDILATGSDAAVNGLSPEDLQTLQRTLERHCPGMPLRRKPTTADIARFNRTLEDTPVQAVLPDYIHPEGKRLTIAQVYDIRQHRLKVSARERFAGNLPHYEEEFAAFVDGFHQTRRRLERHGRAGVNTGG